MLVVLRVDERWKTLKSFLMYCKVEEGENGMGMGEAVALEAGKT
jgi:hypothetical protein